MSSAVALLGLGVHRPARVMSNGEIAQRVETNDEWIRERTGIANRRIAGAGETIVEMGAAAGAKAIAAAGLDASVIDLVILATCSATDNLPGGAGLLASTLGCNSPGAFDINAACAGFSYGISLARDAIKAGSAHHVLVVGSESLTEWLDWDDRSTCILFGDGAGAAVVGPSPDGVDSISPVVWGSDGTGSEAITIRNGGVGMDGQKVFRWATSVMVDVSKRALEAAGITVEQLGAFVPHQANGRIISSLARSLKLPEHVAIADDIAEMGNTSSASIPLALDALIEQGRVEPGAYALLVGFGSGLTYSAQVVRVP